MVTATITWRDASKLPETINCNYCKPKEGGVFVFAFTEEGEKKFRFVPLDLIANVESSDETPGDSDFEAPVHRTGAGKGRRN